MASAHPVMIPESCRLLSGYPDIQESSQQQRQHIRYRLGPDQSCFMENCTENEHSRNVDQPLTGDIDDQGFRRRTAGLQRVDQHIEYAKQEAGAKENVGKGNAIVIRRRIREEYADDLPGKEVAEQSIRY